MPFYSTRVDNDKKEEEMNLTKLITILDNKDSIINIRSNTIPLIF